MIDRTRSSISSPASTDNGSRKRFCISAEFHMARRPAWLDSCELVGRSAELAMRPTAGPQSGCHRSGHASAGRRAGYEVHSTLLSIRHGGLRGPLAGGMCGVPFGGGGLPLVARLVQGCFTIGRPVLISASAAIAGAVGEVIGSVVGRMRTCASHSWWASCSTVTTCSPITRRIRSGGMLGKSSCDASSVARPAAGTPRRWRS